MPNSNEVYSWPEARLYLWWSGESGLCAYAEQISLSYEVDIAKYLLDGTGQSYEARTRFVERDQNVRVNIGRMFAGASAFQMMQSGVNISAILDMVNGADQATVQFILWSAQSPSFQLDGSQAGIWREQIRLVAPDVSGI